MVRIWMKTLVLMVAAVMTATANPTRHNQSQTAKVDSRGQPCHNQENETLDSDSSINGDDPLTLYRWEDTDGKNKEAPPIYVHGLPNIEKTVPPSMEINLDEQLGSKRRVKRANKYKKQIYALEPPKCDRTAAIDANGTKLVLCLHIKYFSEDDIVHRNLDNLSIIVYGENTTRSKYPLSSFNLNYVVGWIVGEEFSSISGFIMEEKFYGSIFINNEIYYVDPSKDGNQGNPSKASPKQLPVVKRRIKRAAYQNDGTPRRRVCGLALVADHIFFEEVGMNSIENTVQQMLYHIREANSVFLAKDFNDDGRSECIGFQVEAITIIKTPKSYVNILLGNYEIPEDFLRKFSRYNFADFCLGLLFTNRIFKDLVLGLSWRGNPKVGGVGGICQRRAKYKEDGKTYSFNTAFISMRSQQQLRIPLRMAVLNMVHELMHAFGAKHDPGEKERPECTPADSSQNGRYLMSKYSNNGRKHNHEILSPCTKESIMNCLAVKHRINCLKDISDGYCGDGILDPDEECDCGDQFQCQAVQSCCAPPTGGEDGKPCTFRSSCRLRVYTEKFLPGNKTEEISYRELHL